MDTSISSDRRHPRRTALAALFGLLLATLVLLAIDRDLRAAVSGAVPVHYVPELGLPATDVVAFGASPGESPGQLWAYGRLGPAAPAEDSAASDRYTLLRRTAAGTWHTVPLPAAANAAAPASDHFPALLGPLAGQATPAGAVALMAPGGIVLRDPNGAPALVPQPDGPGLLGPEESLPPQPPPRGSSTPFAVVDEEPAGAGLLIVPYADSPPREATLAPGVLHYDGAGWRREPIAASAEARPRPLALACGPTAARPSVGSLENCWLLAAVRTGDEAEALALFRRVVDPAGEEAVAWQPVTVAGGLLGGQAGETPPGAGRASLTPLGAAAQMLTVTAGGVWVDFNATIDGSPGRSVSELVAPEGPDRGRVLGSWCYPSGPGCSHSLGARLPSSYRSFAWPGESPDDLGKRTITGLADRATLELRDGAFAYAVGAGGSPGTAPGGAALLSPERGLIADGVDPSSARDGAGQSQAIALAADPAPAFLGAEPVPSRRPLLALAAAPGGGPAATDTEAIAVGEDGHVLRFLPGSGWHQEPMLGKGSEETALRGVAWPTPESAFAVGDSGTMWSWRREQGDWARFVSTDIDGRAIGADFNAVAFSTIDPSRGFAVGEGTIVDQRRGWRGSSLPAELNGSSPDFGSVAFAGDEALATFRGVDGTGGLVVEAGAGWQLDDGLAALLAELPPAARAAPQRVAGLPDGAAAVAGPGYVAKRDGAGAPWRLAAQPLPEARAIAALAVFRDADGALRSIVSIGLGPYAHAPASDPEASEPVPASGYLVRETADGWQDLQHAALPVQRGSADMPERPEPVLALLVDPAGQAGLAVGGHSGDFSGMPQPPAASESGYETAAAMRFPADSAFDPNKRRPIAINPSPAFVVGGQAACTGPCANRAADGLGPDRRLEDALAWANTLEQSSPGNLRAFIYTGGRLETGVVPDGGGEAAGLEAAEAYERELGRLARLFAGSSSVPVLTAPSPDLMAAGAGLFTSTFAPFGPGAGSPYYAYRSEQPGGKTVLVVVLDYASGDLGSAQREWLRGELTAARSEGIAAIVVGHASLGFALPNPPAGPPPLQAADAGAVQSILFEGAAAAYVFDYPGANALFWMASDGQKIPAFGTGTLGYAPPRLGSSDSLGFGSALLVEPFAKEGGFSAQARLIPEIESLILRGRNGTRLAAGQTELFEALGRRPSGGIKVGDSAGRPAFGGPEPYETFPFPSPALECQGSNCGNAHIGREAYFESSDREVGDFLIRNPSEKFRDTFGNPLPDSTSGYFCAKRPGTTNISVTAGGLYYEIPVIVTGERVATSCWNTEPPDSPPEPVAASPRPPSREPAEPITAPPATGSPPPPAPQATPQQPAAPLEPALPVPIAPPPAPVPPTAVVPAPWPVMAQPPAPPSGVAPVGALSPVGAPAPVSQPAVSTAEQEELEAALQQGHEMRAHRFGRTPVTIVAAPVGDRGLSGAYLPLLAIVTALGAAAAVGAVRPAVGTSATGRAGGSADMPPPTTARAIAASGAARRGRRSTPRGSRGPRRTPRSGPSRSPRA